MCEQWKPVKGYEDCYEVSSLGRVRSVGRYVKSRPGCQPWFKEGRVLAQTISSVGYPRVRVSVDGRDRTISVHRLVSGAFLEKATDLDQVNHIDCDKTNNSTTNLEWVTPKENMRHAFDNGLRDWNGARSPRAKLTIGDVKKIRASKEMPGALARKYGVSRSSILRARNGETWSNV